MSEVKCAAHFAGSWEFHAAIQESATGEAAAGWALGDCGGRPIAARTRAIEKMRRMISLLKDKIEPISSSRSARSISYRRNEAEQRGNGFEPEIAQRLHRETIYC